MVKKAFFHGSHIQNRPVGFSKGFDIVRDREGCYRWIASILWDEPRDNLLPIVGIEGLVKIGDDFARMRIKNIRCKIVDVISVGEIDPAAVSTLKCQSCSYYHGKFGVICAPHPGGWIDWDHFDCPDKV